MFQIENYNILRRLWVTLGERSGMSGNNPAEMICYSDL